MKIIITQDQYRRLVKESLSPQDKMISTIERIGLFNTLRSVGYSTVKNLLPDYFNSKEIKIELIREIPEIKEGISIYELLGEDIVVARWDDEDEDDRYKQDYITYFEDDMVTISTYEFYGGDMYDNELDSYNIDLKDLDDNIINILFDKVMKSYFG